MNSGRIAVSLAAIVVVAGIAYSFLHDTGAVADTGQESVLPSAASASVVHVDDLADSPDKYRGEIVLKAVVARLNKAQGVASVIDFREFEECHSLVCARHYLPVKYDGVLP